MTDASAETIWSAAQAKLQAMLSQESYRLWFASIKAIELNHEIVTLEVPNEFSEVWLTENYLGLLQDVLVQTTGQGLRVKFVIAAAATAAGPEEPGALLAKQGPKEGTGAARLDDTFNPRNTFDNFVVGSSNHFAHAGALAVAQSPGKAWNPLFVYGGTGLGKTHLLHAIGHYIVQHKRGGRVAYLSSEKFTNEYIDAIQSNLVTRFRRKYRQMDLLLIDDVQFLANKERIQEEFFHTFNALHEARKQIVLACDRPANEIQNLEQRLVSRFEWGLVTDLQPPDVETRLAILRKKELALGVSLPKEMLSFLADRIRSNVRRLEGALVRVASYTSLTGKQPGREVVEDLLRDLLHEERRQAVTIDSIQKRVADHFDLRLADMTSKRRPEHIAFPRQVAMYLARELTESSLHTIGEAFGGRDHGTVLHAWRTVKGRMEVDPNIRQVVSYLIRHLGG